MGYNLHNPRCVCACSYTCVSLLSPGFDKTLVDGRLASKAGAFGCDVDLLRGHSALKREALQQRGEEEEELHPGQTFSWTHALPYRGQR